MAKTALVLGGGAPNATLMSGALVAFAAAGVHFDVISTAGAGALIGLLYVLTDYTQSCALFRRAAVILCIIAGVVLLSVGGLALIGSIEMYAVRAATQATENLGLLHVGE